MNVLKLKTWCLLSFLLSMTFHVTGQIQNRKQVQQVAFKDGEALPASNQKEYVEELSFTVDYATMKQLVAKRGTNARMSPSAIRQLATRYREIKTEEEAKAFLATIYSLNAQSLAIYFQGLRESQNGQVTEAVDQEIKEYFIRLQKLGETPLLALLNPKNAEQVGRIPSAVFKNVAATAESQTQRAWGSYCRSCNRYSFPSKARFGGNRSPRYSSVVKRTQGGWLSNVICGYVYYNFPGVSTIRKVRSNISAAGLSLSSLHGFRFPHNGKAVFVHHIPAYIVFGNQPCYNMRVLVGIMMRARG